MLFSSNLFLFAFLPFVLTCYYLCAKSKRNVILLLISFFFYTWGSGYFLALLLLLVGVNFCVGRIIEFSDYRYSKQALSFGVIFNVLILLYFKYFNFFIHELNQLFLLQNLSGYKFSEVILPIGISFYIFQGIAYLVEVYRKTAKASSDLIEFALFMSLFPQLIAGPIVRYSQIYKDICVRNETIKKFFEGIWRFVIGLGKKVLLANNLGQIVDSIFILPEGELTNMLSWLGITCYAFQIYYDFSGYSDMAIGLGLMFGFRFPENFNQPYRAKNITEFWRRWHITLYSWLRDFIYIPLGGNRKSFHWANFSVLLVFLVCGLWHGAAWTFIMWGGYHGVLMIFERVLRRRGGTLFEGVWGNISTFILVTVGWVFFRSETLGEALWYIGTMFGINNSEITAPYFDMSYYLRSDVVVLLLISAIFAFVPFEKINILKPPSEFGDSMIVCCKSLVLLLVFMGSVIEISGASFTPFIYFRF